MEDPIAAGEKASVARGGRWAIGLGVVAALAGVYLAYLAVAIPDDRPEVTPLVVGLALIVLGLGSVAIGRRLRKPTVSG